MSQWLQPIELHRHDGDSGLSASLKLRFHFYKAVARDTNQEAYRLSGGKRWSRTTRAIGSRFTVCPATTYGISSHTMGALPTRGSTDTTPNCLAFQILFSPKAFTHGPLVSWALGLTVSGWIHISYPLPLQDVSLFLYRMTHLAVWRRGRDLNSRYPKVRWFSKPLH